MCLDVHVGTWASVYCSKQWKRRFPRNEGLSFSLPNVRWSKDSVVGAVENFDRHIWQTDTALCIKTTLKANATTSTIFRSWCVLEKIVIFVVGISATNVPPTCVNPVRVLGRVSNTEVSRFVSRLGLNIDFVNNVENVSVNFYDLYLNG